MRNLENFCKKLNNNGIDVISFNYSDDYELFDHEINLKNGYYLQISNSYISINRYNGDDSFSYLFECNTIKETIDKLKEIL